MWRDDCQQMVCSYRRMHPKPEVSLTTLNDKIILRPEREGLSSKFIYCGKWLGVLCKNGKVRDKAQQISGHKLNSTKPCQVSPYVNICLIHTLNCTNSGMCNNTGLPWTLLSTPERKSKPWALLFPYKMYF